MNSVGKRRIRKPSFKTDATNNVPRKWSEVEMQKLYEGLMKHGHKNFEELQKVLPNRSLENIKCFMRTVYDTAGKLCQGHFNIDSWINQCSGACLNETAWKDSVYAAKIIKFLSVDGLLENHPLPERCNGINFPEAYRLVYQALMGYPMQPVNKATSEFVTEVITEIIKDVRSNTDGIAAVKSFLINNMNSKEINEKDKVKTPVTISSLSQTDKKPIKVYQRKKPKLMESENKDPPSLKIVVAPNSMEESGTSTMKTYSVIIENKEGNQKSTVLNVAVPLSTQPKILEEEEELLKSCSYNPLKLPQKWVQEPLYINLQHPPQ